MSSRRFPGKVLAPFRGAPLIDGVVDGVRAALPDWEAVVLTSTEPSDDPLAAYLESRQVPCFRGALNDVLGRFVSCLSAHPGEWVMRICADSPILNAHMLQMVAETAKNAPNSVDLVTTTAPRTFPKGHNAELIRASSLLKMNALSDVTGEDREHVTRFMHRNKERFGIINVESGRTDLADMSLCVDTVEELHQLEALDDKTIQHYRRDRYWEAK